MEKFYIIATRYENSNTAEHGYGDYPESIDFVKHIVEAETKRKAQSKVKKIDSRMSFSGMFGNRCYSEEEMAGRQYLLR